MKKGIKKKTTEKLVVPNFKKISTIPKKNTASETLFIIKAFKAALLAKIRIYQKFINKYEHKPTPSQPMNN